MCASQDPLLFGVPKHDTWLICEFYSYFKGLIITQKEYKSLDLITKIVSEELCAV